MLKSDTFYILERTVATFNSSTEEKNTFHYVFSVAYIEEYSSYFATL